MAPSLYKFKAGLDFYTSHFPFIWGCAPVVLYEGNYDNYFTSRCVSLNSSHVE